MSAAKKGARAKRSRPLFKRGQRVTWNAARVRGAFRAQFGTVRDVHRLGGHGYAYEIAADHETFALELREAELKRLDPLADPALRDMLDYLRASETPFLVELGARRDAWVKAGCPGL